MRVLKFGGSSLASPERIRDVARIVLDQARTEPIIVVVSAFQGVTNQLLDAARLAERGDAGADRIVAKLTSRHHAAAIALLGARRVAATIAKVDALLAELGDALHGIRLLASRPQQAHFVRLRRI